MRIACLAATILLAGTPPMAETQPAPGRARTDLDAVRAALTQFLTAFENLDWAVFQASFDEEATVFFPEPEPEQRFEGRPAIVAHFRDVFDAIRRAAPGGPPYHRLDPEELRIEALGPDAALASFHLRNDQRIARRTVVFRRSARGWRIAHLHASNAPRPRVHAGPAEP
jgi:ketosteroid isomerase-like protein